MPRKLTLQPPLVDLFFIPHVKVKDCHLYHVYKSPSFRLMKDVAWELIDQATPYEQAAMYAFWYGCIGAAIREDRGLRPLFSGSMMWKFSGLDTFLTRLLDELSISCYDAERIIVLPPKNNGSKKITGSPINCSELSTIQRRKILKFLVKRHPSRKSLPGRGGSVSSKLRR